jgi:hypothetical protein
VGSFKQGDGEGGDANLLVAEKARIYIYVIGVVDLVVSVLQRSFLKSRDYLGWLMALNGISTFPTFCKYVWKDA